MSTFALIDWLVVASYFAAVLAVGFWAARQAGRSTTQFFLSGRSMPWWLLGVSMVATTFSTDTPNLVTDIVRTGSVAGNWMWWAFLLTGMLTVFVYARLWRRSGVLTDLEFYELRYSGKPAAFLRGFRAVYLGVFFNVMVMATVTLAAIKIGGVIFGLPPLATVVVASSVTVIFSTAGGFRAVVLTDFLLFIVAMIGSIAAAVVAVGHPKVGGLEGLFANPAVRERMALLPDFSDTDTLVPLIIVPLAVQWWASWYPGAEPGGGGYVAQRMLAARTEGHAIGATLFFNVAHYALRPWPWILVALASIVVFPDLESLRQAFPAVAPAAVRHDLAYPAMLTFLPVGWLGLVVGSLAAAYMSTISTHLNWGSSYVIHDFYRRFVRPAASERELVRVGRLSTVVLMVLSARSRPAARERPAGVPDPAPDRRRHRAALHPALVLVADQRLERDRGDGGLLRRRALVLCRTRPGGSARRLAAARARRGHHHRGLGDDQLRDPADGRGAAALLRPADSPRGSRLGRGGAPRGSRRRAPRVRDRPALGGADGPPGDAPGLYRRLFGALWHRCVDLRSYRGWR